MRRMLLIAALCWGGVACTTPAASNVEHHEDRPRCMDEAIRLEDQAHEEIRAGHRRVKKEKKAEHYDRGKDLLRQARDLYAQELLTKGIAPERERNCQLELDRLEDELYRLQLDRPQ